MRVNKILSLFLIISIFACNDENSFTQDSDNPFIGRASNPKQFKNYLFLGHIYQTETRINTDIEQLDLNKYDQIWLGGDVLTETTKYQSNLDYLDSIFDLSNPNTKWALGNHDLRNGNVQWINEKTKRPSFYTSHSDGITYFVLNTSKLQRDRLDVDFAKSQYHLLKSVCDTIISSSHLVILSHHSPWQQVDSIIKSGANSDASNFVFNVDPIKDFHNGVYNPLLKKVQSKGVDVIFISGDYGQFRAGNQYTSSSGVTFLGSGILSINKYNERFSRYKRPNSVLIFNHDIVNRKLKWKFKQIDDIH